MIKKIGIVTHPFKLQLTDRKKLEKNFNLKFKYFDIKKKKNNHNLKLFLNDCSGIIAGTEIYNSNLLLSLKNLEVIFRVGIGIDNIDQKVLNKNKIKLFNTPDAPSVSAAEYSLALILSVAKGCSKLSHQTKNKKWIRFQHQEFSNLSIGVVGLGRIGFRVLKLLYKLPFKKIFANDIDKKKYQLKRKKIEYCNKDKLLKYSDIVSFHVPLTKKTKNYLSKKNLLKMKRGSSIVNTSRGEIINEKDLLFLIKKNYFSNIALDVTCKEPYAGPLLNFDNVSITPHNASMSSQSRKKMVDGTINNIKKFYKKK